ncbi:MAG: hypothetical protein NTU61_05730 [Candidatus Altiarchaeota archaeon]|nr:hypothetical protein [Candidatus Altiarchaeota archaeon]
MKVVYCRLKTLATAIGMLLLSTNVFALTIHACPATAVSSVWSPASLQRMAYALGLLMVLVQGVRYIIADSAQERADVKKGLIYIVVGLLVVSGYTMLTDLYCTIAGL